MFFHTAQLVPPLRCRCRPADALRSFPRFVQGVPTSSAGALRAALFHAGTAAILLLYLLFWVRLNLMQTLPALAALQLATRAAGWGLRVEGGSVRSKQE